MHNFWGDRSKSQHDKAPADEGIQCSGEGRHTVLDAVHQLIISCCFKAVLYCSCLLCD